MTEKSWVLLLRIVPYLAVLIVVFILFYPLGPWLPGDSIQDYLLSVSSDRIHPPTGRALTEHLYESTSIVSYSAAVVLTLLSLAVPLSLLYYNQSLDHVESVIRFLLNLPVDLGGKEARSELIPECHRYLRKLATERKVLSPAFFIVMLLAFAVLLILIITVFLGSRTVLGYSFPVRFFCISLTLGAVFVMVYGYLGTRRHASWRIEMMTKLTKLSEENDLQRAYDLASRGKRT